MKTKLQLLLATLFFCLSCSIYFQNIHKPQAPFWDENYYIATTERYLNQIAQLEPHPPLGLMVIAAGEYLFRSNKHLETRHLANYTHVAGEQLPQGYSFYGIRFFPALFGALSVIAFLCLMMSISGNPWLAGTLALAILFENSFITHFRAAHLDSLQLFLTLCSLLIFTRVYKREAETTLSAYLLLASVCAAAILVKVNSAILLSLFPVLFWKDRKHFGQTRLLKRIDAYVTKLGACAAGTLLTASAVFTVHVILGNELPNRAFGAGEKTWQNASEVYKDYLENQTPPTLKLIAYVVRDYYMFMNRDHRGVPKLDPCKPGENGSHPTSWLFNKKTINYRWDSAHGLTRYVQLTGNQVNWAIGLLGLVMGLCIVVGVRILKATITDKLTYTFIEFFLGLYVIFIVIHLYLAEQRVMYLYHYFTGFVLSLIIAGLAFTYIANTNNLKASTVKVSQSIFAAISFLNFVWLAPLSLHWELTKEQCQARNFLQQVVDCR